jgi:hypothetical protein
MSNLQSAVDNLEAKVRELSDSLVNKGDAGTMSGWIPGGGAGTPSSTGKSKYMVLQITNATTTPPTIGWDWARWV